MFGLITRRELDREVASLRKLLEQAEWEWADWYQKFRNLHARLAKSIAAEERRQGASDPAPNDVPTEPAFLAHLDPISRSIWRQRLAGRSFTHHPAPDSATGNPGDGGGSTR